MRVELRDGCCRSCGGVLTIIDVDDVTMTVQCACGEIYLVEHDAFRDGGMHYLIEFLASSLKRRKP
jgi:hypothetical protein